MIVIMMIMTVIIVMFIKIILYSLKFSKAIYLYLPATEETVFKIFSFCHKQILHSFQIEGPINEMLFCPNLLFLKGISQDIFDLVLQIFLQVTKSSFTKNGEVTLAIFKCFCGDALFYSFFCWQPFYFLRFFNFYMLLPKQKWIH